MSDGGPAFPIPPVHAGEIGIREGWDGMTLRDYFAAKAMVGIINRGLCVSGDYYGIAERAYEHADAMLDERVKQ